MFGSSWTGFGLKDSSLDLDLEIVDKKIEPHKALLEVLGVLEKGEQFRQAFKLNTFNHETLTEGKGSVQLTSSLRWIVL
jgi:hypothetical protein